MSFYITPIKLTSIKAPVIKKCTFPTPKKGVKSLNDALEMCGYFKKIPLLKDSEINYPKPISMFEQIDRYKKSIKMS